MLNGKQQQEKVVRFPVQALFILQLLYLNYKMKKLTWSDQKDESNTFPTASGILLQLVAIEAISLPQFAPSKGSGEEQVF